MENKPLELNVLTCNRKGCFTDIRASFVGPEFEGSVVKVIRDGDITVGIRADESPAYIYIKNIDKLDQAFHDFSIMVESRIVPDPKLLNRIAFKCLEKMQALMLKYYKKKIQNQYSEKEQELASFLKKEQMKFSFSPAPAYA